MTHGETWLFDWARFRLHQQVALSIHAEAQRLRQRGLSAVVCSPQGGEANWPQVLQAVQHGAMVVFMSPERALKEALGPKDWAKKCKKHFYNGDVPRRTCPLNPCQKKTMKSTISYIQYRV